jgi:hypothetical protein
MRLLARIPVAKFLHSYTSTPVTTAAWVEIISATTAPCSALEIFSGNGAIIKLSLGAAGQEDASEIKYYVIPGGSSILLPIEVAKGKRISAKSMDTTANSGSLVFNFFA